MSSMHLIDTQASTMIIKSAQEHQQKYIRSRAARHNKTPPLDAYKQDDWVLATWQGLSLGRSRPKKLPRTVTVLERPISSHEFQLTAFGKPSLSGIQQIY